MKTPTEWAEYYGFVILDPGGWRGKNHKDYSERIPKREFLQRAEKSTLSKDKLNTRQEEQ